ncbi:uncharacterized protein K452DRAFT_85176 [Aplosporella prunicola CBS 121167]|uniref:Uncharacterized protein n=1 Tax=Aplosporella prunicola CBS 121167 TaxID=1176127 RepID=A0A6A6B605_9PEZI|nr:uncharacterized protein K452DRAFT_85176 [Aplosporella prunicola CBS 121167]KAF2138843.1 hypothetical protein K452DRAFT_85176 [Aplosporella prunicola CBS 121167]
MKRLGGPRPVSPGFQTNDEATACRSAAPLSLPRAAAAVCLSCGCVFSLLVLSFQSWWSACGSSRLLQCPLPLPSAPSLRRLQRFHPCAYSARRYLYASLAGDRRQGGIGGGEKNARSQQTHRGQAETGCHCRHCYRAGSERCVQHVQREPTREMHKQVSQHGRKRK